MKQLGLQQAPIWDADIIGRGLTPSASVLASLLVFSTFFLLVFLTLL